MATPPEVTKTILHRPLDPADLKVIFKGAGSWHMYYMYLLHTGLRAGDVAMLTYGNINRKRRSLRGFIRKSRRIHEFPMAEILLKSTQDVNDSEQPLFLGLYAETERKLNDNLAKPRKFMQTLLKNADPPRPKATLHSFRVTFNNTLQDLGLSIEDRQVLLAHSSSETTKIYTHPNLELAREYVNRIIELVNLEVSDNKPD